MSSKSAAQSIRLSSDRVNARARKPRTNKTRPASPKTSKKPRKASKKPPAPRPAPKPRPSKASTPPAPRELRRGDLPGFVRVLLALITSWQPHLRDPAALALLAGIHALLRRVDDFCAQPLGVVRLAPQERGAVVGLRLVPFADDEVSPPFPAAHAPALATLASDLAVVLDHHHDDQSPAAMTLRATIWAALGATRRYLEAPEGRRLDGTITPKGEVTLRLVDASAPAPSDAAPAPAPSEPPPLGPAYHRLVGRLSEAFEALSALDRTARWLDGEARSDHGAVDAPLTELHNRLDKLHYPLAALAETLTGEPWTLPPVAHAVTLHRLHALLGKPEHRAADEQALLKRAAESFARPAS